MHQITDTELMFAAQRYLHECFIFSSKTGYSPDKANELLSAMIVNRWLAKGLHRWEIQIEKKLTGFDGIMLGEEVTAPYHVEFKSSKSASFQFDPEFKYESHGCIVMTQFKDGVPCRLFLACGATSIRAIQKMAEADMQRDNFNAKKKDMALIHVTAKPGGKGKQRRFAILGLVDQLGNEENNKEGNHFVVVEGAALAELVAIS